MGHIPQTQRTNEYADVPSSVMTLCTTSCSLYYLYLAVGRGVGRRIRTGVLLPPTPLMETGTTLTLKRSSSNLSATALQMLKPSEGNATGEGRSRPARCRLGQRLLSARSTPDDLSASIRSGKGLLDVGTEGDSLTVPRARLLASTFKRSETFSYVDKVLPSVINRLEAWGAAMASPGRSHGASRLLRLLHEKLPTPTIRKALVAEQRGAFIRTGAFWWGCRCR